MWTIDAPASDFRIRTPSGAVGPDDYRGVWLALVHCTRPCVPGCAACLANFGSLAAELRERGCRLLVAIDEPDEELRARLGRPADATDEAFAFGTWETPERAHVAATLLVLVDPDGIVKGVLESPNDRPIPVDALLAELAVALGHAPPHDAPPRRGSVRESFGCVDWYEYDDTPPSTPPA